MTTNALSKTQLLRFFEAKFQMADRYDITPAAMLTTIFRLVLSRLQFVTFYLLVIAVIDVGHVQSTTPRPSGFTRIARDLGRKFSNGECEGLGQRIPMRALLDGAPDR